MNKGWYAVITADVLYDKNLTHRQKILVAVIGNLSNEKGFCFASNKYLSEIMDCSVSSLQRDLKSLENKYISRVIKLNSKGEVEFRALTPIAPVNTPHVTRDTTPHPTGDTYNNKYINNKDYKLNYIPENEFSSISDDSNSINTKERKEKNFAKKEKKYSKEVENCYLACLSHFEDHLHPSTPKQKESWLDTIEKLNRIDKIPFSEIHRLTQCAREDDFWSKNFLSLNKLRQKNKQGVKYIVVFFEKFKQSPNVVNRQTEQTIKQNLQGW